MEKSTVPTVIYFEWQGIPDHTYTGDRMRHSQI